MVRSIDCLVIMALQHLNPISVKDLEFVFLQNNSKQNSMLNFWNLAYLELGKVQTLFP